MVWLSRKMEILKVISFVGSSMNTRGTSLDDCQSGYDNDRRLHVGLGKSDV